MTEPFQVTGVLTVTRTTKRSEGLLHLRICNDLGCHGEGTSLTVGEATALRDWISAQLPKPKRL
jgi:hypothetical protein